MVVGKTSDFYDIIPLGIIISSASVRSAFAFQKGDKDSKGNNRRVGKVGWCPRDVIKTYLALAYTDQNQMLRHTRGTKKNSKEEQRRNSLSSL
eukprot:scaffold21369_cov153-Skeletonema_dohrnii-CCMP3373.AAC.1